MSNPAVTRQLAKLAKSRHPSEMPSRGDMEATGTVGFIQRIDADTPVESIIFRVFRDLRVPPSERVKSYVTEQLGKYEVDETVPASDADTSPEVISHDAAIRSVFTRLRAIATEKQAPEIVGPLIDSAEKAGCFIVEQAMKAEGDLPPAP